ncbi:MAG: phosphoglycerate dehydrogenase [Verrucomicrobiota bacterium]
MPRPRILLTTTSFQDTPGAHHALLEKAGYEIVRERGPLPEARMLELVGEIDAMICGDDALTAAVIDKALPRLKVISKYGIGLDKIDVEHATARQLPVLFTPGVNHTTVAEHTMSLLLALRRRLVDLAVATRAGEWKRLTGHEIMGSTLGIVGLGRIGKEVAKRARAFGLEVMAYDIHWDAEFAAAHAVTRVASVEDLYPVADFLSLHTFLSDETRGMINAGSIAKMKDGAVILNCARGELVETAAVAEALESGKLGGYGADVLEEEPPPADHPLLRAPHCLITPHIGSRTYESVQRQAGMACENLIRFLNGETPLAQANRF